MILILFTFLLIVASLLGSKEDMPYKKQLVIVAIILFLACCWEVNRLGGVI